MVYDNTTIIQLAISAAVLCLFVALPWVRRMPSVGLPFCFLLSLAIIHWLGAFIYILPWHSVRTEFVYAGFEQTFFGILAFAAGSLLIAPLVQRSIHWGVPKPPVVQDTLRENRRLPQTYLLVGLAFYVVLAPAVRFIPSIAAVSVSGVYLIVVGLCLACWRAHIQESYVKLFKWLLLVCSIPFLTVITLGFIGYGAGASLIVFTFVAAYYRPRWQAVVGLSLMIFLGLSLFVTYARDRNTLRQTIWGGADYSQRMDKLISTFTDFEFIDFRNPRHLFSIDERLNQNYLVGRAVETLELGRQQYAAGETFLEAFLALVPRIIWPDKPVRAGSPQIVSRYTGMRFAAGTSVGVGQVMEFYINFGTPGVIAGFFILGVLITVLDSIAALRLREGDWQGFMSWFLPSISLLNVGGSLVEVFGTAASSLVLVIAVNKCLSSGVLGSRRTFRNIPAGYRPQTSLHT